MKDEFLKTMQREFPDCRIAVRGDTAMIVGSEEDVAYVTEVFRVLRYLFRENTYLTTQHVHYSARLIKEGQSEALHNLYEDTVGISARGRLIKPKTLGQKRYVDSIPRNPVTFGIGPAGTRQDLPGRSPGGFLSQEPRSRTDHPDPVIARSREIQASCPVTCRKRSTRTCARSTTPWPTCSAMTSSRR